MCTAASYWASIRKVVYACGRGKVGKKHFEGEHDMSSIRAGLRKPTEFVHSIDCEAEALSVIESWEASLKERNG
jgi:tRNA(Arg) A34 adenosine deaminase TadA